MTCVGMYKKAALCYLSIFNHCNTCYFCFLKYEVAFIALNVELFKYLI